MAFPIELPSNDLIGLLLPSRHGLNSPAVVGRLSADIELKAWIILTRDDILFGMHARIHEHFFVLRDLDRSLCFTHVFLLVFLVSGLSL